MRSVFALAMVLLTASVGYATDSATPPAESVPSVTKQVNAAGAEAQEALKKRVAARWEALIRRDFAAAYEFNSPAYRKAFSLHDFKMKFGDGKVAWKRVDVVAVEPKGDDTATVDIKIHITYANPHSQKPVDMATSYQESWVYTDDQWWYLVK